MAQLAGLELETRHADWNGAEFTAESRSHVSVYRIPTDRFVDAARTIADDREAQTR